MRAAAEHFKGRVDRYSIWNEPNYPAWISPQRQSPQIYRKLYEAGYKAIKEADPAAQVLIGETVPYGGSRQARLATPPLKWLRDVACVNARYKRKRGLHAAEGRRLRAITRTSSRTPRVQASPARTTPRSGRWAACARR